MKTMSSVVTVSAIKISFTLMGLGSAPNRTLRIEEPFKEAHNARSSSSIYGRCSNQSQCLSLMARTYSPYIYILARKIIFVGTLPKIHVN